MFDCFLVGVFTIILHFGLHFELILGAFWGALASVKIVFSCRYNLKRRLLGTPIFASCSGSAFGGRPGSIFIDFGSALGFHWGSILQPIPFVACSESGS